MYCKGSLCPLSSLDLSVDSKVAGGCIFFVAPVFVHIQRAHSIRPLPYNLLYECGMRYYTYYHTGRYKLLCHITMPWLGFVRDCFKPFSPSRSGYVIHISANKF